MSIEREVWQRLEMMAKPFRYDAVWKQTRKEQAILVLDTWKRINDMKDPYFDPEDKPDFNINRMKDLTRDITSEAVKDSKTKEETRKLNETNKLKTDYYKIQNQIRKHETAYKNAAVGHLVLMYSRPPKALDEISELLEKYLANRTLINDLMTTINSNW